MFPHVPPPPPRPTVVNNVTVNISSLVLSLGDSYNIDAINIDKTNVDLGKLRKIVSKVNSDNKIEETSQVSEMNFLGSKTPSVTESSLPAASRLDLSLGSQNLDILDETDLVPAEEITTDVDTVDTDVDKNTNQREERQLKIILLGKPGCGKGTHGKWISEQLSIPVISTGDEIRALLKSTSEKTKELREKLVSYTSKGELVPDDLVIDILKERVSKPDCKNGYILDGFPRTVNQAEALEKIGAPDLIIHMQIDNSIIEKRMTGRRSCPNCGRVFNINSEETKPKVEGKCDSCNSELIQRDDDKPETVKNRLEVYEKQTAPLVEYYSKTGKLKSINVNGPREEVTNSILELVNDNVAPIVECGSKSGELESVNVDGPREEVTNSVSELVDDNVASKS